MAVPQPQFEGGGPPVLVRNTFLDIDDRPPTPPALQRAKTAPPPRSGSLILEDDDGRPADETSSSSEDDEGDVVRRRSGHKSEANGPQAVTRDWYESGEDWRWASYAATPKPSNLVELTQAPMVPVAMSPLGPEPGLPAPEAVVRQPPSKSSHWSESTTAPLGPVSLPAFDAAASIGSGVLKSGTSSIEVSAGSVPAALPAIGSLPGAEENGGLLVTAPQPQTLTRAFSIGSGFFRVHWTVDARKLRGNDKQAVSPPFELSFGAQFPSVTFKMMIYPKVMNDSKGGASFKKARGRGFVQLKCEAELSEAIANVSFRISIGSGENKQAARGPKSHNFSSSAVCGLDKDEEEWDFQAVVDQDSMTFIVCLEIVPSLLHVGSRPVGY